MLNVAGDGNGLRTNGRIFLMCLLMMVLAGAVKAQQASAAADASVALRLQLVEIQAQITPLMIRSQELEEAMKPENIEQAIAGFGSTKPDAAREQLRRSLTIEYEGVNARLRLLQDSQNRLSSAVAALEIRVNEFLASPMMPAQAGSSSGETSEVASVDIQTKISTLQMRLTELDYELDPEMIAKAVAPAGSTKPEELRERRHRRLTIERDSVIAQLELLQSIRIRS